LSFTQRNLRHIWGGHDALPSPPIRHLGGRVPLSPAGFTPLIATHRRNCSQFAQLSSAQQCDAADIVSGISPHRTTMLVRLAGTILQPGGQGQI